MFPKLIFGQDINYNITSPIHFIMYVFRIRLLILFCETKSTKIVIQFLFYFTLLHTYGLMNLLLKSTNVFIVSLLQKSLNF